MRIPKQSKPIIGYGKRVSVAEVVRPSDCPDGNLKIYNPAGGEPTTVTGVVGCCYDYPDCNVCNPNQNWDSYIGKYFNAMCGDNNSYNCKYETYCVGI